MDPQRPNYIYISLGVYMYLVLVVAGATAMF